MNNNFNYFFSSCTIFSIALFCSGFNLSAQIVLERELVGSAVGVARIVSNPGVQELMVDDSFGETMIGFEEGDIIITVGFQQTENALNNIPPSREAENNNVTNKINVNAYPNPTVRRLTVDLGKFASEFEEIRIIDTYGRTVKYQRVRDRNVINFNGLDQLTAAQYYLQGISKDGKLHQLTKVLILTSSSNN